MSEPRDDLYPGYDVQAKRDGPSWDRVTTEVVDRRLAVSREPVFFSADEFMILKAVCARIVPQPALGPEVPMAAYVDEKMAGNALDGYRHADLPPQGEAWRRGLAGFEASARAAHGRGFAELSHAQQDGLLKQAEAGELSGAGWEGMPSRSFFEQRVLVDPVSAYYAHPIAWSEIGYGGPASPRGYVRMALGRRDPWEAAEAKPGVPASTATAERHNTRVR